MNTHNQSQACVTEFFLEKKNDQGSGLFWSVGGGGGGAATEKVLSASLLNPDPEISERNWFVDLGALAKV